MTRGSEDEINNPRSDCSSGRHLLGLTTALAQQKPNILVIFGEDVGIMNLSAYHRGMVGGSTPNLGRIATMRVR
jgi:hypothetical protein